MLYVLNYIVRHHTLNLNENISENIEKIKYFHENVFW